MSNNKQSSLDLMFNRAISVLPMGSIDARQRLKDTYEQAKAMHKEEIMWAYMNVNDDRDYRLENVILKEFAEAFYNETFGQ